jgi:hypothetical protein
MIIYGIKFKCEGNFKWQIFKKSKLVLMDEVLYVVCKNAFPRNIWDWAYDK